MKYLAVDKQIDYAKARCYFKRAKVNVIKYIYIYRYRKILI